MTRIHRSFSQGARGVPPQAGFLPSIEDRPCSNTTSIIPPPNRKASPPWTAIWAEHQRSATQYDYNTISTGLFPDATALERAMMY